MSFNIKLYSGLLLRNTVGMLVEKFRQWPWDIYDGDPPLDPNVIDPGRDVDRVYRIGARTPRHAYESLLDTHSEKLSACLRSIPTGVAIEDTDLPSFKQPIVALFDTVCCKHVKIAGATKLLYPFRPSLLPVIDSVVDYYYWYATSIHDEDAFRRLSGINGWGEYVFALLCLIQTDVKEARTKIDKLLAACKGQPFVDASRVRVIESLIWHYYARAGAVGTGDGE